MTSESAQLGGLPYEHAPELTNHWWWRPGWSPGTHWYAWHFTLDLHSELQRLAAAYAPTLSRFASLDLIPAQWLHITVQGAGNAGDIAEDELLRVHQAVEARLASVPAPTVTFQKPVLHREAVVIPPLDLQPLRDVRSAIREAIAKVWGTDHVPESDAYRPHFSLAYVNRDEDPRRVLDALVNVQAEPVTTTLHTLGLINLNRDDGMYVWETVAQVELTR